MLPETNINRFRKSSFGNEPAISKDATPQRPTFAIRATQLKDNYTLQSIRYF